MSKKSKKTAAAKPSFEPQLVEGPSEPTVDVHELSPSSVKSPVRGLFIELLGDLLVFILCTIVCLQVIVVAESRLETSGAMTELGQTSLNLVENWKAGDDLEGLQAKFGGVIVGQSLTISFDRQYQPTNDPELIWYQINFGIVSEQSGYSSAYLILMQDENVLIDWDVGRYLTSGRGKP